MYRDGSAVWRSRKTVIPAAMATNAPITFDGGGEANIPRARDAAARVIVERKVQNEANRNIVISVSRLGSQHIASNREVRRQFWAAALGYLSEISKLIVRGNRSTSCPTAGRFQRIAPDLLKRAMLRFGLIEVAPLYTALRSGLRKRDQYPCVTNLVEHGCPCYEGGIFLRLWHTIFAWFLSQGYRRRLQEQVERGLRQWLLGQARLC